VYLWRGVLLTMFSHAAAQRRSALPRVKGFVAPPRRRVKRKIHLSGHDPDSVQAYFDGDI
jgi:hypothetical protein